MTDRDHATRTDRPETPPAHGASRKGVRKSGSEPDKAARPADSLEEVASDQLAEDPAALRESVLGEAGQRSGSRLDADRGYGAGNAARDAGKEGSALDEDGPQRTGSDPST